MSARASLVILGIVTVVALGCSFTKQQVKSSADTQCASSCKNQPADTQGECIARCTK